MVEDLKSLIEKINQEGIKAAEDKAQEIEAEAKKRGDDIIKRAEEEAEKIVANAKAEVAKMEKSGEESIRQAGRNLIISLRKEIAFMLDGLIKSSVRDELSPGEMAKIINSLIKNYKDKETGDIVVLLNKEDLKKIEKTYLTKLKDEVKKGVTLRPSEEIQAGFLISYDSGKSHYDFTDNALAEYMSLYLKPKLSELLKGASSSVSKKR